MLKNYSDLYNAILCQAEILIHLKTNSVKKSRYRLLNLSPSLLAISVFKRWDCPNLTDTPCSHHTNPYRLLCPVWLHNIQYTPLHWAQNQHKHLLGLKWLGHPCLWGCFWTLAAKLSSDHKRWISQDAWLKTTNNINI